MISHRHDPGGWMVRWDSDLAARAVSDGDWPNRTVSEYALERVLEHPERIQLIDGDIALSCRDLTDRARRLAAYFLAMGLQPGDVAAFQLPNCWEAAVIALAATMTGVVVNPIVPINRDAEVAHILGDARARLMVIPAQFRNFDYVAMMRRLIGDLPALQSILVTRCDTTQRLPFEGFDAVLNAATPITTPLKVDPDAVKLLMYTSGTTGRPKGVLHSHNTLFADAAKMKAALGLGAQDKIFCPSPLTHITGFLWLLNMPWYGDIPAITIDTWDASRGFALMKHHRCSLMLGATPFLQDLLALSKETGETLDDLRHYVCGGAAVPPSLIYEAAQRFQNCIPWRTFGSTEACTLTRGPFSRDGIRLGAETDGRFNRVEVKLVDMVSGQPVPLGEEGELLVRTSSLCLGYANPEDDTDAFDEEGFLRMGDLGRIVEGDHFVCTGRKKDLIIRGGENISAKEIEDVLAASPRISEVAIVSMPSVRTGEAICAFVIPAHGAIVDIAYTAALIAAAGLARQKTPEHVEIVEDLPKTPAGKVRKDVLRQRTSGFSIARR